MVCLTGYSPMLPAPALSLDGCNAVLRTKYIGQCGTYSPAGSPLSWLKYSTSSTAQVIAVSFHVIEKTWKSREKSCSSLQLHGEVQAERGLVLDYIGIDGLTKRVLAGSGL